MADCAFQAIEEMIKKMKEEVMSRQNISYPEQITVAGIYDVIAENLAEACRRQFGKLGHCACNKDKLNSDVTMDTFILLKTLREDNLISQQYADALFNELVVMKPELKEVVQKDRERGLV